MQKNELKSIGKVQKQNELFIIELEKEFIPALMGLDGFSHLQIIWWGHLCDYDDYRSIYSMPKPYKNGPDNLGIFASRSPMRPNPILLTTIVVSNIDYQKGHIYTPFIDAEINSPIIDIKPYHLSERVSNCRVPVWCNHWPAWYENEAQFDWSKEFNF